MDFCSFACLRSHLVVIAVLHRFGIQDRVFRRATFQSIAQMFPQPYILLTYFNFVLYIEPRVMGTNYHSIDVYFLRRFHFFDSVLKLEKGHRFLRKRQTTIILTYIFP